MKQIVLRSLQKQITNLSSSEHPLQKIEKLLKEFGRYIGLEQQHSKENVRNANSQEFGRYVGLEEQRSEQDVKNANPSTLFNRLAEEIEKLIKTIESNESLRQEEVVQTHVLTLKDAVYKLRKLAKNGGTDDLGGLHRIITASINSLKLNLGLAKEVSGYPYGGDYDEETL